MTTTAQETSNHEVQIDIIRKSLSQLERKINALHLSETEIKRIYAIILEEQRKMDVYKDKHPDLFI